MSSGELVRIVTYGPYEPIDLKLDAQYRTTIRPKKKRQPLDQVGKDLTPIAI